MCSCLKKRSKEASWYLLTWRMHCIQIIWFVCLAPPFLQLIIFSYSVLYHAFSSSFYQDKHEENHQPKLHSGLVIKHNANQRYATNAVTAFIFREIAANHNLPVQVSMLTHFWFLLRTFVCSWCESFIWALERCVQLMTWSIHIIDLLTH